MAVERLDRRTYILAYNPEYGRSYQKQKGFRDKPGTLKADKARFELAEAFTSHAFEACSLDRSDTYPCCQNGNLFIMPHSADLANRSFAEQVSSVCRLRHVRSQSRNSPEALALRLRAKHSDRNYIHSIIALIRELADPHQHRQELRFTGSRTRISQQLIFQSA